MESEEVDLPFLDVEAALNSEGRPFRMHLWHYPKIDKIPHDKWYLFHDMLLRESKVCWQIHSVEDVKFISKVIREHPNQKATNLDFYTAIDHELMEELAQSIQSSHIHKLVLRKDHTLEFSLSIILQTVRNSKLKKLRIVFEPLASEYESLASALQNPHLESFRANSEMEPECWSLITPILSQHQSIRKLRCDVNHFEDICHIIKENKVLERLELCHCYDDNEEELTVEKACCLVSGLKSNSTLKYLSMMMAEEGHVSVLFEALAHNQIRMSTFDVSISDEISDRAVDILSSSLRTNTSLTKLTFFTAPIKKCQSLAEALKVNSTLKSVRFRCDGSDSQGITALCESLKSTNSLTELNLSNSPFKSEHFELVADMIVHNKSIKSLSLHSVKLYDEGLTQISNALLKNNTLTYINIGTFPTAYGYEGLKSFGKMLAVNNTLRKIEISGNFNVKEKLDVIYYGLKNNTSVTNINLGGGFDAQAFAFEQKIVKLLKTNYALTTIRNSNARVSSLLKRNRGLQSEARFKVVILSHNIARSFDALATLPRELWCTITTHVTHPGVEPLEEIIKSIFSKQMSTTTNESRKRKPLEDSGKIQRPKKKQRTVDVDDNDGPTNKGSDSDAVQEIQLDTSYIEEISLASEMPPEILFKIFDSNNFTFSDLHKASCVCTSWNACLKDGVFTWSPIFRSDFSQPLEGIPNRFTMHSNPYISYSGQDYIVTLHKDLQTLGKFGVNQFLYDVLKSDIYAYELISKRVEHLPNHYKCTLDVRINFCRLEKKIRDGEKVPDTLLITTLMSKLQHIQSGRLYNSNKRYIPKSTRQIVVGQPTDIQGVKLHQYQIRAINWMVSREKEVDKEFAISPLLPVGNGNLYLYGTPTSHELLYLGTEEQVREYDMTFKSRGGIIADEMGLGKTVEVIGLILSNPRTDVAPNTDDEIDYYRTKATLIICPNHLVAQWKSEIEKYCGIEKLKVLQITTIVQVNKYTSQDIVDADVVLITYNLLDNKKYLTFEEQEQHALRKLNDKGVVLSHFDWHRVVADEGHERLNGKHYLPTYQSTYRWYMTGTPFPRDEHFLKVRWFLGLGIPPTETHHMHQFDKKHTFSDERCGYFRYLEEMLDEIMVHKLMWRNTKASIKDEYELVKTKSQFVLLDFNPLEKIIYQDKKTEKIDGGLKLCNSFLIEDCATSLTQLFKVKRKTKRLLVKQMEQQKNNRESYNPLALAKARPLLDLYNTVELTKEQHTENSLEWLIERYGTKLANLYIFLKDLFEKDNEARALVFSIDDDCLKHVRTLLEDRGIYTSTVKGNVHKKSKELKNFKNAKSMVRVVLLNTTKVGSGMNLIEASHVIFLDIAPNYSGEENEAQAIGRAYRQGQTKHVTVVRFVIKETKEFDAFEKRCPSYLREQQPSSLKSSSSNLVRSGSLGVLANSQ